MTPLQNERRRLPRKRPPQLVYLELGKNNGGMVLNATEEGIGFRAVSGLQPGSEVGFSFALDGVTHLEGSGEVIWADESGKTAGIRFTQVPANFREHLRAWRINGTEHVPSGREVAAAASAPVESLEKLKRDIRMQYAVSGSAAPAPATSPALREGGPREAGVAPSAPFAEARSRPVNAHVFGRGSIFQEDTSTFGLRTSSPPSLDQLPPGEWPSPGSSAPPPRARRAAAGTLLFLALLAGAAVAGYTYRDTLGGSLIWLGQRLSGESPSSAPAEPSASPSLPAETGSAGTLAGAPQTTPSSSNPGPVAPSSTSAPAPALAAPSSNSSPASAAAASPGASAPANSPANTSVEGTASSDSHASAKPAQPEEPARTFGTTPARNQPAGRERSGESFRQNASPNRPEDTLAGSGYEEFDAARAILRSGSRRHNMDTAVRLLWSGVQKGYAPAEVTLADLYQRGDGVRKNCDQARVLLEAATKKGSPEAKLRLHLLLNQGCED